MATPTNPEELLEALRPLQINEDEDEEKRRKWRYVIYARKSTDDKDKQVRSLPDQVHDCQEFAAEHNLHVGLKDIIQEAESAKEPDIRPKFRAMIEDVKRGKYDGIIAWHPDRLARNMKDAGEIIDLIDKHIIKDLQFKSFTFTNDPSGKMLLGITFVLAKQYSEQLGVSISRGNRRSIEEGKYVGRTKHGYYKDSDQYLRPDGQNFILIKNAFRMRIGGSTYEQIADYLNANGYQHARRDGTHVLFKMNLKRVENFMRDTVYSGVIVYGKKGGAVNLTKIYDFQPAISVPDFMKIYHLDKKGFMRLARKNRRQEDIKASLLRGIVICAACDEVMSAGITPKQNKGRVTRYFYYRCDNEDCSRHDKSVRAKVILDYAKEFLEKKPFSSRKAYNHYAEEMPRVAAERERETRLLLAGQKNRKLHLENKLAKLEEGLMYEEDEGIKALYRRDKPTVEGDVRGVDAEIDRLEGKLKAGKTAILTYTEFLELMEKMGEMLTSKTPMKDLDAIIRKVFSNFTVSAKKVEKWSLAAPFDALYDPKMTNGGDGRNRTAV